MTWFADYQRYFDNFRADRFDPTAWARDAPGALVLDLPTRRPNVLVPVVELAYGTRV